MPRFYSCWHRGAAQFGMRATASLMRERWDGNDAHWVKENVRHLDHMRGDMEDRRDRRPSQARKTKAGEGEGVRREKPE